MFIFFQMLKSGMTADAGSYCLLGDTDTDAHTYMSLSSCEDTQTHRNKQHLCTNSHVHPSPLRAAWVPAAPCGLMDWHFLDDKGGSDSNRAPLNHTLLPPASLSHTTDPPGAHWCPKPRLWVFTAGEGPDLPSTLNWSTGCYFGTLTASSLRLIIWTSDYCSHVLFFYIRFTTAVRPFPTYGMSVGTNVHPWSLWGGDSPPFSNITIGIAFILHFRHVNETVKKQPEQHRTMNSMCKFTFKFTFKGPICGLHFFFFF